LHNAGLGTSQVYLIIPKYIEEIYFFDSYCVCMEIDLAEIVIDL